jgi:hypothetical protein
MDILDLIKKYGISVRQIPFEVKEAFRVEFNEKFAQGKDVQAKEMILRKNVSLKEWEHFHKCRKYSNHVRYRDNTIFEDFYVVTKTPENAGKWLAKVVKHNDTLVRWDIKTDNLSDTLEEAVRKVIDAIENQ